MAEVRKIIGWLGEKRGLAFDVSEDLVGGAAYDVHGVPLADSTMAKAQEVDAVLLGAVGGPKYDKLDFSVKPERGLLRLRKEMDLYSNLRPAQCFDALADFSSLKKDVVAGLDIMIVRELTCRRISANAARHLHRGTTRSASIPSAIPKARSRRTVGLRAAPPSRQQGLFDGKGQRHGIRHPLARGLPCGSPARNIPMSNCRTCRRGRDTGFAAGPSSSTSSLFNNSAIFFPTRRRAGPGSLGMLLGQPWCTDGQRPAPRRFTNPCTGYLRGITGRRAKPGTSRLHCPSAMALRYSFDPGAEEADRRKPSKGAGRPWCPHGRSDGVRRAESPSRPAEMGDSDRRGA